MKNAEKNEAVVVLGKTVTYKNEDYVVVNVGFVQRGRRAGMKEIKIAPIIPNEKYISLKITTRDLSDFSKTKKKWSTKKIDETIKRFRGGIENNYEIKREREKKQQDALDNFEDLEVGDEVKVKYSNSFPKWEKVMQINIATGKVAIERFRDNKIQQQIIEREQAKARIQNERADYIKEVHGLVLGKKRGPKSYRWIHSTSILEIRKSK